MKKSMLLVILSLFLLASFASADISDQVTDNHDISMAGTNGLIHERGVTITISSSDTSQIFITRVAKGSTTGCTRAKIYNTSGCALLGTSTNLSFDNFTFSPLIQVNNGSNYHVTCDAEGSTYADRFSAASFPIVRDRITFVGYTDGGSCAGGTSHVINIQSITTATTAILSSNFTITAVRSTDSASILNFTANITGPGGYNEFYQSNVSTGTLTTGLLTNATDLYNITISSENYFPSTYTNVNVSSVLGASLDPYYQVISTVYSNYTDYNGSNYTRSLRYDVNLTCPSFSMTYIDFYTNGEKSTNRTISCTNQSQIVSGNYQHTSEGEYNLSLFLNTSYLPETNNQFFGNATFISDLTNPQIVLNFTVPTAFSIVTTNITLTCTDNVTPLLLYNLNYSTSQLYFANTTNGTTIANTSTLQSGINTASAACSDFFGTSSGTESKQVYVTQIVLIDEIDNDIFDINNVSSARVYFDDNQTFYDFSDQNASLVNYTSTSTNKLRFELIYSDDTTITRYVDLNLIDGDLRVCANKEGVSHFQQLIIAATERPAILRNVFSNCVVAADYTRFAYQDTLLLQAYSINSLYYLFTYQDGNEIQLAAVDGSISSYINLDTLEFAQEGYNFNILGDTIAFEKSGTTTMKLYYQNLNDDNTGLTATITRMDTDATVYASSSFANPNEFTLYFDYATLANVTNTTLFKLELTKTTASGTETLKRYFDTNGSSGILNSAFAFTISFLLTVFGLTFTVTRLTFSWFGIVVQLMAIAFLSFSVAAWYVTFLLVTDMIILVFIFLVIRQQTFPEVA